ncbi:hypothetical protein MNV49_007764, partial [Pseudohyphozyma bogoriensis]
AVPFIVRARETLPKPVAGAQSEPHVFSASLQIYWCSLVLLLHQTIKTRLEQRGLTPDGDVAYQLRLQELYSLTRKRALEAALEALSVTTQTDFATLWTARLNLPRMPIFLDLILDTVATEDGGDATLGYTFAVKHAALNDLLVVLHGIGWSYPRLSRGIPRVQSEIEALERRQRVWEAQFGEGMGMQQWDMGVTGMEWGHGGQGLFRVLVLFGSTALLAGAATVPPPGLPQEIDIVEVPMEATPPEPWPCDVRAWVRAPDLTPNLLSTADARLIMNGTACAEVVKWEVALRLRERSVYRIAAPNVTVPSRPQWNDTRHGHRGPGFQSGIFEVGHAIWRDPFQLEMEEFNRQMSEPALWVVGGKERVVFDSKVTLDDQSVAPNTSLPLESVRSFAVAVPNVNLPPSVDDGDIIYFGDQQGSFASQERDLSYRFLLSLRNGTILEYSAGHTVFLPESPREIPSQNSTRDNQTRFTVEIELPVGQAFFQGSQLWLNTTITRHNSTAQRPTSITIEPATITEKTWAARHASDPDTRSHLLRDDNTAFLSSRRQPALEKRSKEAKSTAEEAEEAREKKKNRQPVLDFPRRSRSPFGQETKLQDLDVQSVLVNLTIPADMLPSFNGTFASLVSYLHIKLQTSQLCSHPSTHATEPDDLKDDSLWSQSYQQTLFLGEESEPDKKTFTHSGNVSISIAPSPSASSTERSHPTHYSSPAALAPTLLRSLPSNGLAGVEFPHVNTTLRVEDTDELEPRRFRDDLLRRNERSRWWKSDGSWQFVGQVWRRKERREMDRKKAAEGEVEEEVMRLNIQE